MKLLDGIRMSKDTFIKHSKELLEAIDDTYTECWEDKITDDSEDNICTNCNGGLYVVEGGDVIDCRSCNGTGQNYERVFNSEKFLDFIEHSVMFGGMPFYELKDCDIDDNAIGIEDDNDNGNIEESDWPF